VLPFLLLGTRDEDAAADDEYAAFLTFTGLDESLLHRVRLERRPLGPVDLDAWSGVLLGGGPFCSSDPVDRKSPVQRRVEAELAALLDEVVARDLPFLGACYGIGVLGTHQGGTVDATHAEPISRVPVTLTPQGRRDGLLADLPERFEAFVGHKEAIRDLPPTAVPLASSPGCPVQAFRVGRNVYATQFHPELDAAGLCTRIEVYRHAGYFDPSEQASLETMARARPVPEPPKILTRFVQRYGRPAAAAGGGAGHRRVPESGA
jgi:GMP synthase (glutamine-hydrolysing)